MEDELQLPDDALEEDASGNDVAEDEPAPGDQLSLDLEGAAAANADLLERLRLALLASDPAIDPALVIGVTADEVEASFAAAQRIMAGIREALRREQAAPIPAGAPGRATLGPRTAYDKIRSGLTRLG
ncbi:MAG: hypothetical protein WD557_16310 [Dehalococcoidia bacterium]